MALAIGTFPKTNEGFFDGTYKHRIGAWGSVAMALRRELILHCWDSGDSSWKVPVAGQQSGILEGWFDGVGVVAGYFQLFTGSSAGDPFVSSMATICLRFLTVLLALGVATATKWNDANSFCSHLLGCYFIFLVLESWLACRWHLSRSKDHPS